MTIPILSLGSLATYRLALLITEDRITFPLRALFGVRRDGDAEIVPDPDMDTWRGFLAGFLVYLLTCLRCVSIWAGLVIALPIGLTTDSLDSAEALVLPLAFSGGAIAIDAWVRRR
mgnify:FL=1